MEKSLLIKFLGENPVFKIVDFFIENKGTDMSKKDIIEGAGISKATLFNYWEQIEKQEIVRVTRKFGKTKLYTLNSKNPIIKKILELEVVLIEKAFDKRREIIIKEDLQENGEVKITISKKNTLEGFFGKGKGSKINTQKMKDDS